MPVLWKLLFGVVDDVVRVLIAEDGASHSAHAGPRAVEPRVEFVYRE